MPENKFPAAERLKSKKEIQHLFTEGKSIKRFPLRLLYQFVNARHTSPLHKKNAASEMRPAGPNDIPHPDQSTPGLVPNAATSTDRHISCDKKGFVKVAVAVSSRKFPTAVQRNRVKRLIRECYRTNKAELIELAVEKQLCLNAAFVFLNNQIPSYETLEKQMKALIHTLIEIMAKESSASKTNQSL